MRIRYFFYFLLLASPLTAQPPLSAIDWLSKEKLGKMKTAAVLIGLFEKENEWYFPLIKRPMHEKNHPGQIALPGGAKERGEDLQETARREAFEEVGIPPEKVKMIGKLTPLPVPVSNYLIHPFVGILKEEPDWKINLIKYLGKAYR